MGGGVRLGQINWLGVCEGWCRVVPGLVWQLPGNVD